VRDRDRLNEIQKLKLAFQCWSALSYLHENSITHKDIAPRNIVLHETPEGCLVAKLCDFGLAKVKELLAYTQTTRFEGTVMHLPPEFTSLRRNPEKADIYSMGATLCELFTNIHFWHYKNDGRPLDYYQVIFRLDNIYQQMTAENQSSMQLEETVACAAEFLDDGLNYPLPIMEALKNTVYFKSDQRPSAAKVLIVFEETLSDYEFAVDTKSWSKVKMAASASAPPKILSRQK